MAQYCYTSGKTTNCTDRCRDCAKEIYGELKSLAGRAELVTEEAIKNDLGNGALEILKEFGYIECCGVVSGRKMYAI